MLSWQFYLLFIRTLQIRGLQPPGWGLPRGSLVNPPVMEETPGSIPGSGRSPGGGHGSPLQCTCLENPMDRGSLAGSSPWGCRVGHDWSNWEPAHTSPRPLTSSCLWSLRSRAHRRGGGPGSKASSAFSDTPPCSQYRLSSASCLISSGIINVMCLNHPETTPPLSMEKLSSTKPVPGAENVGDCCSKLRFQLVLSLRREIKRSLLPLSRNALDFSVTKPFSLFAFSLSFEKLQNQELF